MQPGTLSHAAHNKSVARYNPGRDNKSLDASGTSGLVNDNSSLTWLSPAASTQPFDALRFPRKVINE